MNLISTGVKKIFIPLIAHQKQKIYFTWGKISLRASSYLDNIFMSYIQSKMTWYAKWKEGKGEREENYLTEKKKAKNI